MNPCECCGSSVTKLKTSKISQTCLHFFYIFVGSKRNRFLIFSSSLNSSSTKYEVVLINTVSDSIKTAQLKRILLAMRVTDVLCNKITR